MGVETFPLHVAAAAAQFTPKEFRRQVNNGPLKLQGCDRGSSGSGDPIGYSRRRILQAAITKRLTPLGVSPSAAARAAFQFSDEGQTGRRPGELFPNGKTLLLVSPEGATVKSVLYDAPHTDVTDRAVAAITIDLNRVAQEVDDFISKENNL
jgi:hypothetical protein